MTTSFFPKSELQSLIDELRRRGYEVVGPTVEQEAIVYAEISSVSQLPQGWTDEQSPGSYRLKKREDDAWFGYVVGPHSWKKYLFPPRLTLLSAQQTERGWEFVTQALEPKKYACLGVRACEIAAIEVQDRTFLRGAYPDLVYAERRASLFLVAVNCTQASSTCFCTSMKTGPRCQAGYDLALTEIETGFVCEVGSDLGKDVLAALAARPATDAELASADAARQQAVDQITRRMPADQLPHLLLDNLNHPRWKQVGERCLSCTNCTLVCPTCFCASVADVRDLNTGVVERQRTWDSCFNPDFAYLSSGSARPEISDRYRQWLTHKLATWHEQFGVSGCVGCGRCITWCPVGIDITEEIAAIQESAAP